MKPVIAIDCGGTNLRVAAVDEKMNIVAVRRIPTIANDPMKLFSTMLSLIDEVKEEAHMDEVPSIGLSMCGVVQDNQVGRVGNLGIESFDFLSLFQQHFPNAKFLFANDANCSALVEAEYGANKGLSNSIFITISTGIGLGVIHKGEMIDLPLEAGRMMLEFNGKIYEAESLLAGSGIPRLGNLMGVDICCAKRFFDGVREKEPEMLRVYDTWIKELGLLVANLQLLFNVDQFALSGGLMKSADVFFEDLERVANAYIAPWHFKPIKLVRAKFDQDVGIMAAATLAWHALKK